MLVGLENIVCYVHVDDVLIHTCTWDEHLASLQEVLRRMKKANLTARPSKSVIGAETVNFAGNRVGRRMIEPQEVDVKKVKDSPRPKTKEVRSFLG